MNRRNELIAARRDIVSQRLRKIMKERNMRTGQLAQTTGICINTLYKYRRGRLPNTLVSAIKICNALGVSLDELYGDEICEDIGTEQER